MFEIRKAVPEDALGITIVNVYTWKTTYTGLMPDDVIDARIAELMERTEKCRTEIEENDNFMVASVENNIIGFCRCGIFRAILRWAFTGIWVEKSLRKDGMKSRTEPSRKI